MEQTAQYREQLMEFLETVAIPGRNVRELTDDDINLVQADLVDSFAVIQIILHLEEKYSVNLQSLGIDPADLVSINGMLSAIERANG